MIIVVILSLAKVPSPEFLTRTVVDQKSKFLGVNAVFRLFDIRATPDFPEENLTGQFLSHFEIENFFLYVKVGMVTAVAADTDYLRTWKYLVQRGSESTDLSIKLDFSCVADVNEVSSQLIQCVIKINQSEQPEWSQDS